MGDLLTRAAERSVDIDGSVFYREWPGPSDLTFVCVHGLGGSSLNWVAVAPGLAERGRVLAPDLAGFGRTPREGRSSRVSANRRLLSRFIAEMSNEPVVLIGNSMGGALSMLQAAYEPETVRGAVLTNPALPLLQRGHADREVIGAFALYQVPRMGEWFMRRRSQRLGPEKLVAETFRICAADPDSIPQEIIEAHVQMARERGENPDSVPAFLEAARSLIHLGYRVRFGREVMGRVECPVLLLHGRRDRLVPLAHAEAAAKARPDWELRVFDDLGHVPMLEAPDSWLAEVDPWLDRSVLGTPEAAASS